MFCPAPPFGSSSPVLTYTRKRRALEEKAKREYTASVSYRENAHFIYSLKILKKKNFQLRKL